MDLSLAGRRVLITGAASGIGRACASAFAGQGAHLALTDVHPCPDLVADLRREYGNRVLFAGADITDDAAFAAAIAKLVEGLGGLDVAVGCAGISGPFGRDITDISAAEFDRVMAVNVRGQFALAQCTVPHLAESTDPAMVLIASDSSFVAAPGMVPYNASKGAVLQLTRALSVDLADRGIRVNCVCPSVVDTPMARADLGDAQFAAAAFPVQRPEQVAAHVLYLASSMSAPINGTSLVSDFGYLARSSFPA